ncbi:MAG: zinc-dependent metalloprotease [Pseudomonadota bacterium]
MKLHLSGRRPRNRRPTALSSPAGHRWGSGAAALLLAGCATLSPQSPPQPESRPVHPVSPSETPASKASADAPSPSRVEPGGLKPFAEVVRGATQTPGYFPLWRKDEKLWIEVPVARLEQPFLLTVNIDSSVGERGLYASQMGNSWVASFRRVGTQMQLVARNLGWRAEGQLALQRAIAQGFSESLLGAGPVASQEHPERKSVLLDAGFLLGDVAGYSGAIEAAFRIPYGFDRTNSFFEQVWAQPSASSVKVRTHFAVPRLPQASSGARVPQSPPDARSFFVGFVYNFVRLPEQPMRPRKADPRLGHFTDAFVDLANEARTPGRVHFVNRWRLEKADPQAPLSPPKEPIVFWLDKNIPPRYRDAVRAGVLEWNKAFERIGFRDALVVKQQSDDADWNTLDARHASIRWYVGADAGTARGPHHSDPRTGEILDADIAMADVFTRSARRFFVEQGTRSAAAAETGRPGAADEHAHEPAADDCHYAMEAAAELDFALEVLAARGDIDPDGPEAEAFVQAVVKDTIMHEVGHTLGLKHNFKASTTVQREALLDRTRTQRDGTSGSVMDYNPFNLALPGEPQGAYINTTLGPYDYWAIEYAYRPLPAEREEEELLRIASRSTEPALAFGDDYDAGGFGGFEGIDPTANRFDLGDDPLAYAQKRLRLTQELWQRVQSRPPSGRDPVRERRILLGGFRQLDRTIELAGKYVGGMVQVRDLPGTARRTYTPVEPARQREALRLLTSHLFATDSFRFRPEFLRSLPPDYLDRDAEGPVSIPDAVLRVQSMALDRLYSAGTANRLLDLPHYLGQAQAAQALSLAEVYRTLQDAVWAELASAGPIDRLRRNLQREHLRRVVQAITRPAAGMPPDAVSLLRWHARALEARLQQALRRPGATLETRAHLEDSLALLRQALRASMQRG